MTMEIYRRVDCAPIGNSGAIFALMRFRNGYMSGPSLGNRHINQAVLIGPFLHWKKDDYDERLQILRLCVGLK